MADLAGALAVLAVAATCAKETLAKNASMLKVSKILDAVFIGL
jgi:hypothetical protein